MALTKQRFWPPAKANDRVRENLDGKQIVKEIVVPGKLVNFVVK